MQAYNHLYEQSFFWAFKTLAAQRPLTKHPIQLTPNSRVLIFTCAGIGDTLTDSVVFKALSETFPGIHLAAVVHKRRRILLEHNPHVARIFEYHKGWWAFFRLQRQLRQAGPWDAILHLRGNDPEPRCHSFLLNPSITVSVPKMTCYGWLCGHVVEQPDWDDTHGVEQTLRIARYVGADTAQPYLVYAVTSQERKETETKLAAMGVGSKSRLVLQLGGGRRAYWRDWPVEHYAALIQMLAPRNDVEICVLGGKDHHERVRLLKALLPNHHGWHNLVGVLSLKESAALLESARAVVSTDTGIMHLAFAVGTRVVAIIHCNNPAHRVGPYGYGDRHRVLQLPRPLGYASPADANMKDITPAMVMEKLMEIW